MHGTKTATTHSGVTLCRNEVGLGQVEDQLRRAVQEYLGNHPFKFGYRDEVERARELDHDTALIITDDSNTEHAPY